MFWQRWQTAPVVAGSTRSSTALCGKCTVSCMGSLAEKKKAAMWESHSIWVTVSDDKFPNNWWNRKFLPKPRTVGILYLGIICKKNPKTQTEFIFTSSLSWLLIHLISIKKPHRNKPPKYNSCHGKKMMMSSICDLSWNKFKEKKQIVPCEIIIKQVSRRKVGRIPLEWGTCSITIHTLQTTNSMIEIAVCTCERWFCCLRAKVYASKCKWSDFQVPLIHVWCTRFHGMCWISAQLPKRRIQMPSIR